MSRDPTDRTDRASARPPPGPSVPPPPEDHGSLVMRFGAAVGAAVFASVIATVPAAVRVAPQVDATVHGATAWLALVAVAFFPMLLTTLAVRHALAALRLFDASAVAVGAVTAVVWALASFVVLAGLGAFLRATTHHHGLAGVTFGVLGVSAAALVAPFAVRAVAWTRGGSGPLRWAALAAFGLSGGVGLAVVGRALGSDPSASALVADVLAFAFASAFGGGAFPARTRPLVPFAIAGPPLAAFTVVIGLAALHTSLPLQVALREGAPLLDAVMTAAGAHPSPAVAPPAPAKPAESATPPPPSPRADGTGSEGAKEAPPLDASSSPPLPVPSLRAKGVP